MYCNNCYGKYWAKVSTKLSPPPEDPITGVHITEGKLYWRKFSKGTDQEKLIHCDTAYDTLNFRWNESRMITMSCTVYEYLRVCGYIMTHYQLTEKYENYNERYIERNTEEKGTVGYDDTVLSSTDTSKGSYVRTTGLFTGFEPIYTECQHQDGVSASCLSLGPHASTLAPLDGLRWDLAGMLCYWRIHKFRTS
jgi:hypothetical protein